MDIAISVKNLSKKYRLYDSPQHRLKEALYPLRKQYHHDFWALKDVSVEVKKSSYHGILTKIQLTIAVSVVTSFSGG